jgi:hypothetical protein
VWCRWFDWWRKAAWIGLELLGLELFLSRFLKMVIS